MFFAALFAFCTYIFDDFHRVQSPRLMTEDYFERVLDEYDALAEMDPPA